MCHVHQWDSLDHTLHLVRAPTSVQVKLKIKYLLPWCLVSLTDEILDTMSYGIEVVNLGILSPKMWIIPFDFKYAENWNQSAGHFPYTSVDFCPCHVLTSISEEWMPGTKKVAMNMSSVSQDKLPLMWQGNLKKLK